MRIQAPVAIKSGEIGRRFFLPIGVLNFTDLEYMNSGGIGLLVTLLIRVQRQGQRLMAIGLSEHYTHIFELTRLNEAIPVFETESEALESAAS